MEIRNPTKAQFIGIRLTTAERAAAEREAQQLGLSLSAYARRAMWQYGRLRREGLTYEQPAQAQAQ